LHSSRCGSKATRTWNNEIPILSVRVGPSGSELCDGCEKFVMMSAQRNTPFQHGARDRIICALPRLSLASHFTFVSISLESPLFVAPRLLSSPPVRPGRSKAERWESGAETKCFNPSMQLTGLPFRLLAVPERP